MDYFMQFAPLIIIGGGASIAFFIVVFYVVKTFARMEGLYEAKTEIESAKVITNEPYNQYSIVFKNGQLYKFSGVDIEILEDDNGNFDGFEVVHDGSKEGIERSDEHKMKFNQYLRYVDDSEILYINQVIKY